MISRSMCLGRAVHYFDKGKMINKGIPQYDYTLCAACGICTQTCPVDCIHEGETMFYIDPVECIACALCETICPVDAIRHIDDVPEEEKSYIKINEDFFKEP